MKIFIDDERMPLDGEVGEWIIARDPTTAFGLLNANAPFITHLSFDNDLGYKVEGRDIMAQMFGTPEIRPLPLPRLVEIRVHSANTVANQAMLDLARSALKAGILLPGVTIENRSALHERYHTAGSWYDDDYETERERLDALGTKNDGNDEIARLKEVEDRYGIIMDGNGSCLLP